MLKSQVLALALSLIPLAAHAAPAKLNCMTPQGPQEIYLVPQSAGVKVFILGANFIAAASDVAPLVNGQAEKMAGRTIKSLSGPKVEVGFELIGEGDYGRPLFQVSLFAESGDGKKAGGAIGNCSLVPSYGL